MDSIVTTIGSSSPALLQISVVPYWFLCLVLLNSMACQSTHKPFLFALFLIVTSIYKRQVCWQVIKLFSLFNFKGYGLLDMPHWSWDFFPRERYICDPTFENESHWHFSWNFDFYTLVKSIHFCFKWYQNYANLPTGSKVFDKSIWLL